MRDIQMQDDTMDRLLAPRKPFGAFVVSLADHRAMLEPAIFMQKKVRPHMQFVEAQAPHNRRRR